MLFIDTISIMNLLYCQDNHRKHPPPGKEGYGGELKININFSACLHTI